MKDIVNLTKELITIPSYVGKDCNESKIGEYIYSFLKEVPYLEVIKQPVKNGRFNIIAKDTYPTRLLWSGHIDTVQKQNGWKQNPLKAYVKENNLYGLGSSDMKGSIAAMLTSLKSIKETEGLMLLFYIDEEYDFLGVKEFIKEYKNKIKPSFIISGDGKNLSLGNACRGLIELTFIVKGQTGHSSQPQKGKNAIIKSIVTIEAFSRLLQRDFSDKNIQSVCNLAFLQGGLDLRTKKSDMFILGREGNIIPDIAEFVLEIRPAIDSLTADTCITKLKKLLQKQGLFIEKVTRRHNLKLWKTKKIVLKNIEACVSRETKIQYLDPNFYGYIDLQLLWEAFNKIPCCTFGPGNTTGHGPNEFVSIKDLLTAEKVYKNILTTCTGSK